MDGAVKPRPIRIAAQLHPQQGAYEGLRRAALSAEDLGFDVLYTWDHFFPLYGDRNGPHFESWTMLAAWAELTSRIEIGHLVAATSYRNPNLVADMARTIDHISGGRFTLGIGAGWFQRDYDEYGYHLGSRASRIRAMEATIPIIRGRWTRLNPPPVHNIPILLAGRGERLSLRVIAEHANGWHGGFPDAPAEMEPKVAALRRFGAEVGRDPAEIEWGVGVEPEDLARFLEADAATYVAMGFTQFTLGFNGPDWTVEAAADWLAWRDRQNAERLVSIPA